MKKKYKRVFSINNDLGLRNYTVRDIINLKGKQKLTQVRVTTIEEAAVATGDMLGTFEGVINGSNVEFRVTMNSSSSATVTTKIDSISIP